MARYIDADAYKKYLDENWVPANYDAIDAQPTADVAPVVHAHWIVKEGERCAFACSNCETVGSTDAKEHLLEELLYCPKCGAKMDEVQLDERTDAR